MEEERAIDESRSDRRGSPKRARAGSRLDGAHWPPLGHRWRALRQRARYEYPARVSIATDELPCDESRRMKVIRYLTLSAAIWFPIVALSAASATSTPNVSSDSSSAALTAIDAAIKSLQENPGQGVTEITCVGVDSSKSGQTTVNQELHGGPGTTRVENMVGIQASGCGNVEVLQNVGSQVAIDRSTKSVKVLKELRAAVERDDPSAFAALLKKLAENGLDVLAQVLTALLLKKL